MKSRFLCKNSQLVAVVLLSMFGAAVALGQSSGFTYQGRLTDGGTAANGNYDLQFALWDSLSGGTQIGSTQTLSTVAVTGGVFTVSLDFGASSFPGANRFLEISARPTGGSFTLLTPRQPITSTPYAVRALNASSADSVPVSAVPSGSGNYIQNTTSAQTANFNISGSGSVSGALSGNIVNSATEFRIGGVHVLSISGTGPGSNIFAGNGAGFSDTTVNGANSFFGTAAGNHNTSGTTNSFFGNGAGLSNTTGRDNAFVGFEAGASNTTGGFNSFFGSGAGLNNTTGGNNSFLGSGAGLSNTTGANDLFVGAQAADTNTTGSNNTVLGSFAKVGADNLTNATAIGANAIVSQSNALVLGSTGVSVGIGTTAPLAPLEVRGNVFVGLASDPSSPGANAIFLANDGGDSHNSFRIDAANDNLYIIAHSNSDPSTSAGIIFRVPVFAGGQAEADVVTIEPGGNVKLANLGTASSTQATLCRNSSLEIAFCNSSSLRYKSNVTTFLGGLNIINRLRPISFTWKQDGTKDIGFGAEEVEKVAPLFTFKNEKGQIEGVRYDRLGVVFVNAIKEQQTQIQEQQLLIRQQQAVAKREQEQIAALQGANAELNAALARYRENIEEEISASPIVTEPGAVATGSSVSWQ